MQRDDYGDVDRVHLVLRRLVCVAGIRGLWYCRRMDDWARRFWFAVAVLHTVFLVLWVTQALAGGPPEHDWSFFQTSAIRAWTGDWDAVYAVGVKPTPTVRFLYPPYAIGLYLPTVLLSKPAAYLFITGLQLGAVGLAIGLLWREVRPSVDTSIAVLAGFFGSAAFAWEVILGQTGGMFLLAYVLAVVAWRRGRPGLAGTALGILGVKPHWTAAPAILLAFVDRRAWAAFAGVGAVLVAASLPLGLDPWRDFFTTAFGQTDLVTNHLEGRHNLSVRGLVLAVSGSGTVVNLVYAVVLLPLVVALVAVWRAPVDPLRKVSALVLFTVSANLYVNIYDALVLLVPVMDWASGPDRLPRSWVRLGLGAMAVAWLWDARTWLWPVLLPVEPGPFCLAGLVAAGWLVALGIDARRRLADG
ncbi:MAG: glycosyltransferase family 87 protein [Myxococcota bacterium]